MRIAAGVMPRRLRACPYRCGLICLLALAAIGARAAPQSLTTAAPEIRAAPAPGPRGIALAPGRLLIASRELLHPNFRQSIVLLIDYGKEGALGVIINRRTEIEATRALPEIAQLRERDHRLYVGGPVAQNVLIVLIRSSNAPIDSIPVLGELHASFSLRALEGALDEPAGNTRINLYTGYAGWAPGQLDAEVGRGDWLVAEGDIAHVFAEDPASVWPELIRASEGRWVMNRRANVAGHGAMLSW